MIFRQRDWEHLAQHNHSLGSTVDATETFRNRYRVPTASPPMGLLTPTTKPAQLRVFYTGADRAKRIPAWKWPNRFPKATQAPAIMLCPSTGRSRSRSFPYRHFGARVRKATCISVCDRRFYIGFRWLDRLSPVKLQAKRLATASASIPASPRSPKATPDLRSPQHCEPRVHLSNRKRQAPPTYCCAFAANHSPPE
jgi:hypothetical protein